MIDCKYPFIGKPWRVSPTSFLLFVALFAANRGRGDRCLTPSAGRDAGRVPVRPVRLNASWQVCLWNSCVLFVPAPLPCPCWQHCPLWGWRALLCFASPVGASGGPRRGLSHTQARNHTHLWLILQWRLLTYLPIYLHFCCLLMSFCVQTWTLCHSV